MKKRKIKRVIIGVGYPWYFSKDKTAMFDSLTLHKKAGKDFPRALIDPKNTGNWNKIRLVAEILE